MKARAALMLFFALLFLGAAQRESDDELRNQAASAPSAERYPNTDALVLRSDMRVQIEAAGVVRTRQHRITKVFTKTGLDRLATMRIPFSSAESVMKLLRGRAVLADGSILALPEDAFDVAPLHAAGGVYQDMMEAVVTIPDVATGDVIETLVTVNHRSSDARRVDGAVHFRGPDPSREQVFAVRVPADIKLNYAFSSDLGRPLIRPSGASRIYTWRALNRPPLAGEPLGPDEGMSGSRVIFSTYPDWEDVHRHLAGNFYMDLQLSGEAAVAAESLSEGKPGLAEVAARLEDLIAQRIKRVPLPPALLEFRARPAQEIFESGNAYDFDIAVLTVALLQRAGVEAIPVMVAASRDFIKSVPAPIQFDRIAVVIGSGDDQVWVYPDSGLIQSLGMPPWGRTVLWLMREGYKLESIAELPASKNSAQARAEMKIDPDGSARGNTYAACSGIFNPNYMLREGHQSLDELADARMRWPGREIRIDKAFLLRRFETTCNYELSWSAEGAVRKSGDLLFIRIPPSFFASPVEGLPLHKSVRMTPVVFPSPWEEQEQIDLAIPDGMVPFLQPANISIVNSVGRIDVRATYRPEEKDLQVERFLRIEYSVVPASAYPALRELLTAWRSPASTTIVLAPARE